MKKLFLCALLLLLVVAVFANTYTIGTGTSSTSYSPFYGLYDYGWNKIIYTAAEINTAGLSGAQDIFGFGFYAYNTPVNHVLMDQKVYVRHTALPAYGTATDETGTGYPASAGFTQVFDANVVFNGIGWYYIMFSAPFAWNGTDNLEVFWENWDGDYYSGYPTHTYTSTSTNYRTVYKYADNTFPTTVGSRTYNRPNFRLVTQTLDVPQPAGIASPTDGAWAFTDVTLVWNNGQGMASSYDVYLGTASDPPFVANIPDMTYSPTLAAGTTYYWKIVPRNANGPAPGRPIWSFTTPGANQLAESFENTTFPPTGWSNPGAFTRSTTTPYHLTAGAYKSTATAAMLNTPMLEITETSELNFMARSGVTTGIGRIQIKYSDNGAEWNPIGDPISMPSASTWNNYVVDLSPLAGDNYMLGFEVYSSTTSSTTFYIDYVFGPDFAALTPDPAEAVYPADAGWAFQDGTLSWSASPSGGIPNSYDVYFGTSSTPPFVINQAGTTYTPTLAANMTYYWQIVPRNDTGGAENCPIWSFKTPTTTQLAESFEVVTPFPPLGWANPGTWSGTTITPFHGSRVAYKSASTTPAILSTPILEITAGSTLDFYYRTASTTGYGMMNIKYSTDRVNWNQIGTTISMPTTTTWNHATVALGAIPAGNYYLAFEVLTSTSTSSIYIDHVFGPELAAVAPGPVTLTLPADLATGVAQYPTFTWAAPTVGGVPTGYRIYCDTNTDPTTQIGDVTELTFTATAALNYSTPYYWKVVAYNGTGSSADSEIRSFTTREDPTIYTLPWSEDFNSASTLFPPTNWTRWSGLLADPAVLTPNTSSTYWYYEEWLNTITDPLNYSACFEIWSTSRNHWLMTPPIQMPGAGYQLEFDIALTYWNTANLCNPAGTDDKFIVLIGNGSTWTPANIVRQWDNAGSPYVYNDVPNTGMHVTLPLDSYTGVYYVAFYGESTVSNADNDFFVDNVIVRQTPAGAPEHVTLVSPVDGTTGVIPESVTLSWNASLTGGTPAYYGIYVGENPLDPGIDYYGEYYYETTNTNLDLSAQIDIDLIYNSTWYWAVLPFNSEGQYPDPNDQAFMIWDFTIIEDPTIIALPHEEYFDSVTAPALPYGWTTVVEAATTAAYVNTYNSATYAVSTPNSARLYNSTDIAANLLLITPDFSMPLNTIKVRFYARASTAGEDLYVGTYNPTTQVFTQVGAVMDLTTTQTQFTIPLSSYTGADTFIAFKHGVGTSSRTIYIDNVEFVEMLANDLAATTVSNPGIMEAGTAYDFTVGVYNEGTATQSAYIVKLMSMDTRTELATLSVTTPLDPGASAQHILSWTPSTGGAFQVYGQVVLTGDQSSSNNATATTEVYVVDASMEIIPVGDDATTTSGYYLPLTMYYKNSVTEELYFTDEMHLQSGTITAVVYKNNFLSNLQDKPVKIWMAHTTATDLTGGWLAAENYTPVFDGVVDFPSGINYIVIPLTTPYPFTGGTLATRVNRPMDTAFYSTSDKFYYTTNPDHTSRSRYLYSDSVTYTPLAPEAAGTAVGYFPNTMFVVQNAVMQTGAILEGYVRDAANAPIVGATVTLTERVATTTDDTGFYRFTFWDNTNVDVTAAMAGYYSQSFTNLALTLGSTVTQNFSLTAMPRVTVSGTVTANDFPGGLVGADISIFGGENYTAVTGTGGAFSILNVLGSNPSLAYTIEVSKEGYQTYSNTFEVTESNVNLGTINLIEFLWTPYNLVATHSGDNAQLVWDPAGEPDYFLFDFEADNGGWVGSGVGDWEWTNTYPAGGTFNWTESPASCIPPTTAYSGTGLWGTKLYTNYTNAGNWSYLSKTVDLAGFINPQLRFWRWNNLFGNFDYYQVKVNSTIVMTDDVLNNAWAEKVVDLSAYANQTVEIQFAMYATSVVAYAGLYLDDIYIGPAPTRNIAHFGSRNGNRSFDSYDVYRFLAADEANELSWTQLQSAYASTTYADNGFASLEGGIYKWAVKANYTTGLESNAIISNSLGRVYDPSDIAAETVGATVVLTWTAEPGANYYKVYECDNPSGTFSYLGYSATPTYTISAPPAKKFYRVTAVADEPSPAPPAKISK